MAIEVNAQFKMSTDGNISVSASPSPNNYIKSKVDFSSTNNNATYNYCFYSANTPPTSTTLRAYGIFASSWPSTQSNNVMSWGIYGQAGNGYSGLNYGVLGVFGGATGCHGAGIYGASRGGGIISSQGNYAGFFNGDVKSNATMYANAFTLNSDTRLKKNIISLTSSSSDKILQLNAVQYQYKSREELMSDGTIPTDTAKAAEDNNINKIHFGYIAQDLQQIFPELVYEGDDGFLAVDYVGLIPLMIEAIKEQNATITDLQKQINNCCILGSSLKTTGQDTNSNNNDNAVLYQNIPNPFNTTTTINYYLNIKTTQASIYVFNMQGTLLKSYEISKTGKGSIIINGGELTAGMYMYSLFANGKEIDTKRMILTK